MPSTSGSDAQQAAKNDNLAQDNTQLSAKQPCKATLQVTCVRADSKKGVKDITVKAAGKTMTSDADGLVDFGEVEAGTYDVEIELSANDAKKYKAPAKKSVEFPKTKKLTLELAPWVTLEIVLIDNKGIPVKEAEWKLTEPPNNGKTKEDGKISIADFPWKAKDGTLEVTMPKPVAAQAAAAQAAAAPVEYPPAIKPSEFQDDPPKTRDDPIKWKLAIDDIEKRDDDNGVVARLHNLGFSTKETKRAVETYQRLFTQDQNPTGKPADIKDDIKKRHDIA